MKKYTLEFILQTANTSIKTVKDTLTDFGEELEITPIDAKKFQVKIMSIDPTLVFDVCAQFGRITSAKIE